MRVQESSSRRRDEYKRLRRRLVEKILDRENQRRIARPWLAG